MNVFNSVHILPFDVCPYDGDGDVFFADIESDFFVLFLLFQINLLKKGVFICLGL